MHIFLSSCKMRSGWEKSIQGGQPGGIWHTRWYYQGTFWKKCWWTQVEMWCASLTTAVSPSYCSYSFPQPGPRPSVPKQQKNLTSPSVGLGCRFKRTVFPSLCYNLNLNLFIPECCKAISTSPVPSVAQSPLLEDSYRWTPTMKAWNKD